MVVSVADQVEGIVLGCVDDTFNRVIEQHFILALGPTDWDTRKNMWLGGGSSYVSVFVVVKVADKEQT